MNSDRMQIPRKLIIMWITLSLIGILFSVIAGSHVYYSNNYNLTLNLLTTYLGYILAGILLGMHYYIGNESKKDGSCKIDWSLILGFILPGSILYLSIVFNILNIGVLVGSRLGLQFPLVLGLMIGYAAVLALYKN
jgi:hypothetical protein